MKKTVVLGLLLCAFTYPTAWAQRAPGASPSPNIPPGAILYDNFNQKWIDFYKWAALVPDSTSGNYFEACYFSTNVMECVREIQNGKLRLAVRSYGSTNSNDGNQYGESKLMFPTAQAQGIKSVTADVTVRSTTATACPANPLPYFSAPQAMITATFFNSGSGTSSDNVSGILTLAPESPENLGTIDISGFLNWQGQYSGYVYVGSVAIGTPVRTSLRWVQPQHKFVVSFQNLVNHQVFSADIPYTMSDNTPSNGNWSGLYAQALPYNCMDVQTAESLEATYDNIVITR